MFKIEKGIPLPEPRRGSQNSDRVAYPFATMRVGDSFFIPTKGPTAARRAEMRRVLAASYKFKRRTNYAVAFSTRSFSDGVRVWRVS